LDEAEKVVGVVFPADEDSTLPCIQAKKRSISQRRTPEVRLAGGAVRLSSPVGPFLARRLAKGADLLDSRIPRERRRAKGSAAASGSHHRLIVSLPLDYKEPGCALFCDFRHSIQGRCGILFFEDIGIRARRSCIGPHV
jgi:hypothetical protein